MPNPLPLLDYRANRVQVWMAVLGGKQVFYGVEKCPAEATMMGLGYEWMPFKGAHVACVAFYCRYRWVAIRMGLNGAYSANLGLGFSPGLVKMILRKFAGQFGIWVPGVPSKM